MWFILSWCLQSLWNVFSLFTYCMTSASLNKMELLVDQKGFWYFVSNIFSLQVCRYHQAIDNDNKSSQPNSTLYFLLSNSLMIEHQPRWTKRFVFSNSWLLDDELKKFPKISGKWELINYIAASKSPASVEDTMESNWSNVEVPWSFCGVLADFLLGKLPVERAQATWTYRLTEKLWWSKEYGFSLIRFLATRRAHQERNAEEKECSKEAAASERIVERFESLRKVDVDTFCKEIVRFRGC